MNNSILYSSTGRSEKIMCSVESNPESKISLLFNNEPIDSNLIKFYFNKVMKN